MFILMGALVLIIFLMVTSPSSNSTDRPGR
jgi:hypothetical protein